VKIPAKLGGFALATALVFGGAYLVGERTGLASTAAGTGHGGQHRANEAVSAAGSGGLGTGGLLVSQDGYRLQLTSGDATAGKRQDVTFRILGPGGTVVTEFTPTHDKPLHLIVVRRDLSGFQHVHPTIAADGIWRAPMTFATAGDYRLFADFAPAGSPTAITLGTDVAVAGNYVPAALPASTPVVTVDGYTVRLAGILVPGRTSKLTLTVSKGGHPVTDLQPYLAAYGHLVALRDGDLAYLHVHPEGEPGDGKTQPGPQITFFTTIPSAGDYRLYLDFRHQDMVRTAEFTVTARQQDADAQSFPTGGSAPTPAPAPAEHDHGGH
jgi:hypothetical protein